MINKRFKEYFTFTKKERNGLIVLLLILLVLILFRVYQSKLSYNSIVLIDDEFKQEIEIFEKSLTLKQSIKKEYKTSAYNKKKNEDLKWYKPDDCFNFDPNTASEIEFRKLGFAKKQILTLLNYREKGGVFYKNKDLLKIYGIDKEQFEFLSPFIDIQLKEKENKFIAINKVEVLININSATKEQLVKLNGIGNTFAERIIKYRDLLGGYLKKEQLLEVYGMDSTRYSGFSLNILIDSNQIHKINLNDAEYKTLVRHPYLNIYQTKAILKYRELEGDFNSIEQIHQNRLLLKEEYLRLKPYLKLK
jgi:competence ComEA-like helix-hairpin-helix protein